MLRCLRTALDTCGCHNTTYQQAVGGIGALRGGAGAYFSYKQCIKHKKKQKQKSVKKCGKNVFILSPVKLFESERRATIVRACACERKSLGFKETCRRRRHFRNGEVGDGRAIMKWSRLIITFFRAIGFLLFFFCTQLKVSGEVLNVRGPTERKKNKKKV